MTGATRSEAQPDVPALAEFVLRFEYNVWHGVGAPKDTRADIVHKLTARLASYLPTPKTKEQFALFGGTALGGSPAEFSKFVAAETKKWAR